MKRSRLTNEQIIRVLQEADRNPVSQVTNHHRGSEPSIYAWRKKFGEMGADDVKHQRQLKH